MDDVFKLAQVSDTFKVSHTYSNLLNQTSKNQTSAIMNIHYIQHVPFEGLGCIADRITLHQHAVTATRIFAGDNFPDINNIDCVIIMGGPMGTYEEEKYPWIKEEKKFILQAVKKNKKILGICLGAQMIAAALGAKVYPNKEKEIGWFPVFPAENKESDSPFYEIIKSNPTVFHWHGDTFDLPQNSTLLASSEGCVNQLFCIGNNIIGMQFHLEVTTDAVQEMILHGKHELVNGKYIQPEKILLDETKKYATAANQLLFYLLDKWMNM